VVSVPAKYIDDKVITLTGYWIKSACVWDEELIEGDGITKPEEFISKFRETGLNADLFTFAQKLPDTVQKFRYRAEWDNFAVIPITTYSEWFKNRAESSVQRAVRKAAKSGIVVRVAEFDDAFIQGIKEIQDESPVRQGRPFWHYRKSFDDVKREYSTYAARNIFLGAYLGDELIGFIRMTSTDKTVNIIQLLSKMKYFDKRPANALIAKAVEVCEQRGLSHLQYCNYVYNDPNSSLTEFKRRNGFEPMYVPRYYIPLTWKGKVALAMGIHRGLVARIPKGLLMRLLKMRNLWYERRLKSVKEKT
jgi:hypothetical protein